MTLKSILQKYLGLTTGGEGGREDMEVVIMVVSANWIRDETISNDRKKRGFLRLFLFLMLYEVFFTRYSIYRTKYECEEMVGLI